MNGHSGKSIIKKKSPQSAPSNKNRRMFSALLYIKYRVKCTAVEKEEMNQYTELPDLGVFFFLSLFACWLYLYLKINLSDFQVWKISNQFPSWWHVRGRIKIFQKFKNHNGKVKMIKIFIFFGFIIHQPVYLSILS